ncbi:PQ loop repeat-domain-containing protein [Piptocephalis cylindrospora]|uniref:PQ loop repeat-domain-containing protein n=1 Tax=Piptocephalis cylindrospora TaxID=1907219 RepID=A0A4P9Y8B0_9FUNG|nr:PQ loop repeat-domain-containing protein [Piptocephalis cylindrospora]|eukprot:RKP15396.1 PQ loop repeat-domain-containing protein [Piptocephalis cylindrospora]
MSFAVVFSAVLGWIYFAAWSISFYPQVWLNYRRKSVKGLSLDFLYLNILGFSCYTIYNVNLFANPSIRAQYQLKHDGHLPQVQPNDVVFGAHALVITMVTIGQTFWYRSRSGPMNFPWTALILSIIAIIITVIFCALGATGHMTWLDVLYEVSMVKVVVSFVKYCPQLYMNFRRKSTQGWSIGNILLDFTGGLLSLAQSIFDAGMADDWGGLTGNPSKLALSILSLVFDTAFIIQHYGLYRNQLLPLLPASEVQGEEGNTDPPPELARVSFPGTGDVEWSISVE